MPMTAFRRLSACVVLSLLASSAWGWGATGHRVIGALAQAQLSDSAQKAVSELLAGEPEPTLAGVSTWADDVRANAPEFKWTTPLHWVNFPPGQCDYQPEPLCHEGLCVVAAIERYQRELADPSLPLKQRREALKFVVHFVGDVHQPLHAGYQSDRGGNDFQISYQREGWNLHSVWDSLLIDSLKLGATAYTERMQQTPLDRISTSIVGVARPAAWAEESCAIVQQADFYPPRHKITASYLEAKRDEADQRLKLAGARLAALLNSTL